MIFLPQKTNHFRKKKEQNPFSEYTTDEIKNNSSAIEAQHQHHALTKPYRKQTQTFRTNLLRQQTEPRPEVLAFVLLIILF